MARCAATEFHLYVPLAEGFVDRALFMELWASRQTFLKPKAAVDPDDPAEETGDFR